MICEKQSRKFG